MSSMHSPWVWLDQVLYGEGDRFGCVLDIPASRIVWCVLPAM